MCSYYTFHHPKEKIVSTTNTILTHPNGNEMFGFSVTSFIQKILWLLVHPFLIMNIVVLINTYFMFPNEDLKDLFFRGIGASRQALMFSIVDSLIYGNWLFKVTTAIFLPNWLCLWFVQFASFNTKESINLSKKIN